MFVDHIRIYAKAGDGGSGSPSFRRESFVPKGGPDGGDGGIGGSIVLEADVHSDNLTTFYYDPNVKARSGEAGSGRHCSGKAGEDKIVKLPVGTIVYRIPGEVPEQAVDPSLEYGTNATYIDFAKAPEPEEYERPTKRRSAPINLEELEIVVDLTEPGQRFTLCQGGKGGLGNMHFKSSRNRTPVEFTEGEEGESGFFYLELRKIADAGLVGYPNAGKSTLLTRVSAAHPKIAPYPFTTLTPHIGVVEMPGFQRYTVADIPGLIEGAHDNIGLGHDFLRHIVRCKLLVFVLDMAGSEGREPLDDLQTLRKELDLYDPKLSERPWVVVANKMDLPEAAAKLRAFKKKYKKTEVLPISADRVEGIEELKTRIGEIVLSMAAVPAEG